MITWRCWEYTKGKKTTKTIIFQCGPVWTQLAPASNASYIPDWEVMSLKFRWRCGCSCVEILCVGFVPTAQGRDSRGFKNPALSSSLVMTPALWVPKLHKCIFPLPRILSLLPWDDSRCTGLLRRVYQPHGGAGAASKQSSSSVLPSVGPHGSYMELELLWTSWTLPHWVLQTPGSVILTWSKCWGQFSDPSFYLELLYFRRIVSSNKPKAPLGTSV